MAIRRSVVQIDVQDDKWKAYLDSFKKYNTSLANLPASWRKQAESSGIVLQNIKSMTGAANANSEAFRKVAANMNDMANKSRSMEMYWKNIVKDTKQAALNTYQQVTHLLRATGIAAGITGLATGAGMFGLDRLAREASNDRRSALGLGNPTGRTAAFGVGFGRAIDTNSFLHGVARARGDLASSSATAMRIISAQTGGGLDPQGAGDTGEMSDALLERIRQIALRTPEGMLGTAVRTNQLDEFGIGAEDLRRIKKYSPQEWSEFKANETRAGKQLGMNDATQKKWEDFYVALQTAGEKLKTGLINGLEKLTPGLAKLTDSLSDFLLQFTSSSGFAMVINDFAKGLDWAAKYVSSDDFKKDLEGFGNTMKGLYQGLQEFVAFFSSPIWSAFKVANNIASAPAKMAGVTIAAGKNVINWATGGGGKGGNPYSGAGQPGAAGLDAFFGGGGAAGSSVSTRYSESTPATGDAEKWRQAISKIESGSAGGSYSARNPTSGALGRYQVMPANIPSWSMQALGHSITAEEFLANPQFQDKIFDTIFGGYVRKYGSVQLAARAWYAGEGGMWNDKANDKASGGSGISNAEYGRQAAASAGSVAPIGGVMGSGQAQRTRVDIYDNTGGTINPVVSGMGITAT